MKLKNLIMFSAAALAFTACSNDGDESKGIQGEATVIAKIQNAVTRGLEIPSTGSDGATLPVVVNNATITLTAGAGRTTKTWSDGEGTGNVKTFTFNQVRNPQSISVTINGESINGVADNTMALKDVVGTGLAEPLYAATTSFTQTSETTYTVSLTPVHRLARLQFSGVKYNETSATTNYKTLTFDGLFLNGIKTKEDNSGTVKSETDKDATWTNVTTNWAADAPVFDAVGEALVSGDGATVSNIAYPKDSKCYAYNIFPVSGESSLPKLTLCFTGTVKDGVITPTSAGAKRYAKVARYKLNDSGNTANLPGVESGYITSFVAGYIYNITNLTFEDEDLGYTPSGGQDATLTATVTVLPWTLVNGSVEWE